MARRNITVVRIAPKAYEVRKGGRAVFVTSKGKRIALVRANQMRKRLGRMMR